MKQSITLTAAALLAATLNLHAQGSLTPPPGAPAPVMKSLDQVESRTPLVSGQPGVAIGGNGTITISQSGSYYLTKNLTITTTGATGIVVNSPHVTLDLNGFVLSCTSVNGNSAIAISASNVTVRNGHIQGATTWNGSAFTSAGWYNGVSASPSTLANLVVSDLTVSGVRNTGIDLGYGGNRVERSSVNVAVYGGIFANSISFCTARQTGSSAIYISSDPDGGMADNCFGQSVGASGIGVQASDGTVNNCSGYAVGGDGISAENVANSRGTSVSGTGISATVVTNCIGRSTSGTGLSAVTATHSSGNTTSAGTQGVSISGTASFCQGNRPGGVALQAGIAIGCTALNGTITSAQKHLGTP